MNMKSFRLAGRALTALLAALLLMLAPACSSDDNNDGNPEGGNGGNTNNGKFFWNDQSSYEGANLEEPNKALYFSKEGAYIEFPAVDGKTLSKIEYINSTGARNSLPTFDRSQ